jgi:DNA-binding HxlR family transcriptional regulator
MVHREVIPEKPPKTVYSLTAFGESILPVLDAMCQWGSNYIDGMDVPSACCTAQR